MANKKYNETIRKTVVEDFCNGNSMEDIHNSLGISQRTITRILADAGLMIVNDYKSIPERKLLSTLRQYNIKNVVDFHRFLMNLGVK